MTGQHGHTRKSLQLDATCRYGNIAAKHAMMMPLRSRFTITSADEWFSATTQQKKYMLEQPFDDGGMRQEKAAAADV